MPPLSGSCWHTGQRVPIWAWTGTWVSLSGGTAALVSSSDIFAVMSRPCNNAVMPQVGSSLPSGKSQQHCSKTFVWRTHLAVSNDAAGSVPRFTMTHAVCYGRACVVLVPLQMPCLCCLALALRGKVSAVTARARTLPPASQVLTFLTEPPHAVSKQAAASWSLAYSQTMELA